MLIVWVSHQKVTCVDFCTANIVWLQAHDVGAIKSLAYSKNYLQPTIKNPKYKINTVWRETLEGGSIGGFGE